MIVGEAPGEREVEARQPFVGPSGALLNGLLREAGLEREACFVTNVIRERPPGNDAEAFFATGVRSRTADHQEVWGRWPDHRVRFGLQTLQREIEAVKPTVVIALGNVALWALTGEWGIRKWRSSILQGRLGAHTYKVIPSIHPAAVLRDWPSRGLLLHDLRRAAREVGKGGVIVRPDYRFITRPSFEEAKSTLLSLLSRLDTSLTPIPIACDIETRAGHIACIGFAWSRTEAICIPWMCVERPEGYWGLEEELELISLTNRLMTHRQCKAIWQNGAYDHQYEWRWHGIQPNLGWDTMLAHHAMFSISPKSLDHLSSLYCDQHVYWKDDGKLWDPSMPEDKLWAYNCEDCVRTFEIWEREEEAIAVMAGGGWPALPSVVEFQHKVQPAIVRMMHRGVRSDEGARARMAMELAQRITEIQSEINYICGQEINIRSAAQMRDFFYRVLGQTPIYKRLPNGARGPETCDDDALAKIAGRQPVLRPLIARIQAIRSAGVFLSTFVKMPLDVDGRLRCSYNVAGTKTYRLSSSENAFGSGGNLQNIPAGDEDDDLIIPLPNIRKLFLFDPGMTGFDLDGDSADLRIVVGESGCKAMQEYFRAGAKPYVEIAREFYRDPRITKEHPSYKRMKALCHGSNYGGEPKGLAERIGLPVHDIERMQRWYFGMCPEIKAWQEDIKRQVEGRGWIENPFGYRLYIWDRVSRKLINEALAWTPQSTVAIWINRILVALDESLPWIELLLQVHDSLTGQFPTYLGDEGKRSIVEVAGRVEIPCRTGTIRVPIGLKTSTTSWGDCK